MANFSMLDHIDKLTSVKGGKYICPACKGSNFSMNKATGAYDCYDGCESKDIREVVAPWGNRDRTQAEPKPARPARKRQWIYTDVEGNPCIQVNRTDDGNGGKKIYQAFWESNQWTPKASDATKAKLKKSVTIYRHAEILKAREAGQVVFWVEGEPCADLLWDLGIPATTSIGGSAAYKSNGDYSQVLKGASVVICPDLDVNGLKYADLVAVDYPEAKWFYAFPDSLAWKNPPKDKGLDIADWVSDFKLDATQIMVAIELRRIPTGPKFVENVIQFPGIEAPEIVEREDVEAIFNLASTEADVKSLFPTLYPALFAKAERFGVPVEAIVGGLLPVCASLLHNKTELEIEPGYSIPPMLWCGVVGGSGAAKTPVLQASAKPLQKWQMALYDRHELDMADYETAFDAWTKSGKEKGEPKPEEPIMRSLYTSDFTIEAVVKMCVNNVSKGLLVHVDELKGFFKSFGEYKGGGGSDRQKWLSSHSGLPVKTDRKGSQTLMVERASVSIAGSIQPSVLRRLMGEEDEVDGLWARILWFSIPDSEMPAPGDVPAIDISEYLKEVYSFTDSTEGGTFHFEAAAKVRWIEWHRWTESKKMKAASQSVQAIYPKAREQAARIALVVHLTEAAAKKVTPSLEISLETLMAAISLTKYCVNQAMLIYGDLGVTEDDPEAIRIANLVARFEGQSVRWKQVRSALPKVKVRNSRRAANKSECVQFLRTIVKLGYAVDITGDCSEVSIPEKTVEPEEYTYEYAEAV